MARAAERGDWLPHLVALAIAAILAGWGTYAFSAAGRIVRLPFLRTALVLIVLVLLARVALAFVSGFWPPLQSTGFRIWSTACVFVLGTCFAIGILRGWPALSPREMR